MEFTETGWKIDGSSGGNVRIGTPVARVELGAGNIVLPIINASSGETVRLSGRGAGITVGLSISRPLLNGSLSHENTPSKGIGNIYAGLAKPESSQYRSTDFHGGLLVHTLGAGKQISATVSCATWLSDPVETCMARLQCSREELIQIARNVGMMVFRGGVVPPGASRYQIERFIRGIKAIGFFTGSHLETQLLGMSADAFFYRVSS